MHREILSLFCNRSPVQVVGTSEDGKVFDGEDAQLVLDKGTPRFYIMRLPKRGLRFHRITYHQQCTQCLGGLSPPGRCGDWASVCLVALRFGEA